MLKSSRFRRSTRPLSLEALEHRRVLATVTLNTDLGLPGEFRTEVAAAAPGDTIDFNLSAGNETITLTMGEVVIDRDLTVDGANTLGSGTAITLSGGNATRVLNVTDGAPTLANVNLMNLSVTAGDSFGAAVSETGGGIRNEEALTISDANITGNNARSGGGIGNVGGTLDITDTMIDANTAYSRGGGLHNTAAGSVTITRGTISGNTATNDGQYSSVGGGISSYGLGSSVNLNASTVTGNVATHDDTIYDASGLGGGLGNDYYSMMTLEATDVVNNTGDFGGGAWIDDGAQLDLSSATAFTGNTAGERGGGVFAADYATVNVTDSAISGNAAPSGTGDGGAIMLSGSGVTLNIDYGTINNNYSYDRGGAIYASAFGVAPGQMVNISNTTLTGNTALDLGGAINFGQLVTAEISDTTVVGNSSATDGGGIRAAAFDLSPGPTGAYLTILDSNISGNLANDDGGGIGLGSSMTTYLRNVTLEGNSAYDRGGALYSRGDGGPNYIYTQKLTIIDSVVSGNSATDDGGGLHLGRAHDAYLSNLQITDNYAVDNTGGVRFSFGNTYPSYGTFQDSLVQNNTALDGGGGVEIFAEFQLDMNRVTVDSNTAYGSGGGVLSVTQSDTTIRRSTISNNVSYSTGGGIDTTNGTLLLDQSTVSGNTGYGNGGGIYSRLDAPYATTYNVTLSGTTVTENYSVYGGGLFVYATDPTEIRNTIVSGNLDSGGVANDIREAGYLTAYYSFVGDNSGSTLAEGFPDGNGNLVGGPVGGTLDAMLGALQDNGGSTLTHYPMAGSPVIDAGDPTIMGGTDQRSFNRVTNGRLDMGSTEFDSEPATVTGDFNEDGLWNCLDIDALVVEIVAGTNDARFDMNGDGVVDLLDVTEANVGWLAVGGAQNPGVTGGNPFLSGDANLDGVVDGQDFIVWNGNKFTAISGWCFGDFNADGLVDGQDFIIWNQNKFTSSNPITAGDPEAEPNAMSQASLRLAGTDLDVEEVNLDFTEHRGKQREGVGAERPYATPVEMTTVAPQATLQTPSSYKLRQMHDETETDVIDRIFAS